MVNNMAQAHLSFTAEEIDEILKKASTGGGAEVDADSVVKNGLAYRKTELTEEEKASARETLGIYDGDGVAY
jgi:hypothetical protein